ncbi:MAG: hypothetical protein ACP5PX_04280 [Candidatus Hadarchaeum sp.]|uniref:hypothetical protein n=1 Tax=Candidatus Hadarchaeum sp. TaxID=2883567 RepID=UPI003D0E62C0
MLEAAGYVILGLVLVMVPGFLLSVVLYPKRGDLDFWSRLGASLGLGAIIAAFVGYVVSFPGLSVLSLGSFTMATLMACIFLAILAFLRGGSDVFSWYKDKILKTRARKSEQEQQVKLPEGCAAS